MTISLPLPPAVMAWVGGIFLNLPRSPQVWLRFMNFTFNVLKGHFAWLNALKFWTYCYRRKFNDTLGFFVCYVCFFCAPLSSHFWPFSIFCQMGGWDFPKSPSPCSFLFNGSFISLFLYSHSKQINRASSTLTSKSLQLIM